MSDDDDDGSDEEDFIEDESVFIEREVTECFAIFDQKNTGLMPSKLLEKALRSLGIFLTPTEVQELVTKYDKEGFVEFPDFATYATEKLTEIEPMIHLKTAFAAFDAEKEGSLPGDRFKKWMTTLGDPLTDNETKELYRMGDPANRGTFVYEEAIPKLL